MGSTMGSRMGCVHMYIRLLDGDGKADTRACSGMGWRYNHNPLLESAGPLIEGFTSEIRWTLKKICLLLSTTLHARRPTASSEVWRCCLIKVAFGDTVHRLNYTYLMIPFNREDVSEEQKDRGLKVLSDSKARKQLSIPKT
jgi:hypothetical protein